MTLRSPEVQALIDIEYKKLENFDPEIRDGLITKSYHSLQEKKDIELRISLYNAECLRFRDFCESIVIEILSLPKSHGQRNILDGDKYLGERIAA